MKKTVAVILALFMVILSTPLVPRAQTSVACGEDYVVQVGDTLATIADETLNDPLAFPALVVLANALPDDAYTNIDDPNIIEEGWTICIPAEEDLPELLAEADPAIQALARQIGLQVLPPLESTPWVLVGYGNPDDPTLVEPGTVVTAQFADDGSLSGSGGCNSYNATYEFGRNNRMTIATPAATQSVCDIGQDQEQFYLGALGNARAYEITSDGFLQIEYSTGLLSSDSLFFVAGQAALENTQWVLRAYGNPDELQSVEPATTITAVFTRPSGSEQGSVIGYGGCNGYSTPYTMLDDTIQIEQVFTTMAFCEVGSAQESTYLTLLGEAETVEIVGKQLQLSGPNGVLIYTSANLPLEQVLWTLESFGDPAAQQPIAEGLEITALFASNDEGDGGTVSGSAGCNSYNATYEEEGQQLTIGQALTTLMACETGEEAEQAFLAALGTVERYQVLGDQLRLFSGDQQVITFRANRTPLQETYWKLTAYGSFEAPQSPPSDADVTAVFERQAAAPSGVVAGSTGCNGYSATYAASLSQMKVNPPINNLAFCDGAIGDVERSYLQGLASAEAYRIIGNTLQVLYDGGEQSLNFVASQRPPVPPTAIIDGPIEAQVGDTVTFNGSGSQGSESPIVQYSWDFGDSRTAEGETVSHIYGQAGVYTVRLTVVDERGVSSSATVSITINEAPSTSPVAVIDGPTQAVTGEEVTFQGGNSIPGSSPIASYAWSIDGPQQTSAPDVRFTTRFDQPGQYDVTLTVTDQDGLSDSASLTITVDPIEEPQTPPTAVIEGPTEATVGQDVTFQGGNSVPGSTPIVVYSWSIAGPQQTSVPDVRFTTRFDRPGQYDVTLTVTDQNGLSDTSSLLITINEEPPEEGPTAVIEGPTQAVAGEDVTFQGGNSIPGSSPIVSYGWGIDGPQPRSAPDVRFTTSFNEPGLYNVSLTVTDQNDLSDTSSLQVEVTAPDEPDTPPTAVIEGPVDAFVGESVTFQGGNSVPGSSAITGYAWDFGDGQTGSGASASAAYATAGTYQVSLTVTDENGLSNSATTTININPQLEGVVWVLNNSLPDTRITAEFGGCQVSGSSGCNTYSGTVASSRAAGPSNNITVGPLAATEMACEEAVMNQEQNYLASLSSAQSYTITGNTLTISYAGGALTFQAAPR